MVTDNHSEFGSVGRRGLDWDQVGVVWVPGLSSYVTLGKPLDSFASSFLLAKMDGSGLHLPGLCRRAIMKMGGNV